MVRVLFSFFAERFRIRRDTQYEDKENEKVKVMADLCDWTGVMADLWLVCGLGRRGSLMVWEKVSVPLMDERSRAVNR